MLRNSDDRMAARRARWLAELSHALDEAQNLVWRLCAEPPDADTRELCARLQAARQQIKFLQGIRHERADRHDSPEWINQGLWNSSSGG